MEDKKVYRLGTALILNPISLTSFDVAGFKELYINNLDDCKTVEINLEKLNELDISGFQFIKSLENYCELNGLELKISNIPNSIKTKFENIGVSL